MGSLMNLDAVEQIVALLGEYPVSEIRVEQEGQSICVRKGAPAFVSPAPPQALPAVAEAVPMPVASAETDAGPESLALTAPMVGLFHHARPPIRYGALLTPGQIVGNIESMKLMNEVTAEPGGRVLEVLIEDGSPVEYGQALFRLSPE